MKNIIIVLILFISTLILSDAKEISVKNLPLFATVTGVAEDDVLNIRHKANPASKKVGTQVPQALMGVEKCVGVGRSTWCRVYQIAQNFYSEDFHEGWVNAYYLNPVNRGYVLIDGKGNCEYALQCKKGQCEVVVGYEMDNENQHLASIKTKWIERTRLKGESHFGAMCQEEECNGFCTTGRYVEDYLIEKNLIGIHKQNDDPVYKSMFDFIRQFNSFSSQINPEFIHPKLGLTVDYHTEFSPKKRHFTQDEIEHMDVNNQKIFWGYSEGKGDKILMTLRELLDTFPHDLETLKEIKILSTLKDYQCPKDSFCKGYELLWYNKSIIKDMNWVGLIVILQEFQGKWYLVGLLKDRWTI